MDLYSCGASDVVGCRFCCHHLCVKVLFHCQGVPCAGQQSIHHHYLVEIFHHANDGGFSNLLITLKHRAVSKDRIGHPIVHFDASWLGRKFAGRDVYSRIGDLVYSVLLMLLRQERLQVRVQQNNTIRGRKTHESHHSAYVHLKLVHEQDLSMLDCYCHLRCQSVMVILT